MTGAVHMTDITDQKKAETFSAMVDAMERQKARLKRELETEPESRTLLGAIEACDEFIEMTRMIVAPRVH
jgi:hypothetical protein